MWSVLGRGRSRTRYGPAFISVLMIFTANRPIHPRATRVSKFGRKFCKRRRASLGHRKPGKGRAPRSYLTEALQKLRGQCMHLELGQPAKFVSASPFLAKDGPVTSCPPAGGLRG